MTDIPPPEDARPGNDLRQPRAHPGASTLYLGGHPQHHVDRGFLRSASGRRAASCASPPAIPLSTSSWGPKTPQLGTFSRCPLAISFEEFNGREKIGYLPRKLNTTGSPGSDPEDGDLIYFVPWGNLGFYYNTAGVGYSDQVIHIGTYNATAEQLQRLQEGDVTVALAE
ncbi:cyclophilin-like fold protein [Acrocarpospora catenulata]|uniref:cyclophilin-like fold protein n=1 Tax=Acrocarpospora catenulata TaxID=2836182 RepID=UPI00355772F3